jgi:hypothetical protein
MPWFKKQSRAILLLSCKSGETYLPEKKNHLGDPDVDGRITLRRCWALVNAVINLRVP